jgi:hypothetical protein
MTNILHHACFLVAALLLVLFALPGRGIWRTNHREKVRRRSDSTRILSLRAKLVEIPLPVVILTECQLGDQNLILREKPEFTHHWHM